MRLQKIILENFRSYKEKIEINLSDFTALIGKNDIGKSTILEALEIFFNNNNTVKIDSSDCCVFSNTQIVRIGCVFSDIPKQIIIDSSCETSLQEEMLLNEDGCLEIHKLYDCSQKSPKESVYAICNHPTHPQARDLILMKINELKKILKELSLDESDIDLRSSSSIRQSIYNFYKDSLECRATEIPLNKEDAKAIWDAIKQQLPIYALFQADRPSKDEDSEVQDPMKIAIQEAIKSIHPDLQKIVQEIQKNVVEVANRTLEHLKEIDAELANELSPKFKSDPKWDSLFKLSLTGDDSIPINKRGSGVRRLFLLSFFKAELERKRVSASVPVIYAIEEPETSQHPFNQMKIVKTLLGLSENDNCQVIITTHVPALAGEIPVDSLRFIKRVDNGMKEILSTGNEMLSEIVSTLGINPEPITMHKPILICVEGPNDVNFLKHISSLLHSHYPSLPDLNGNSQISIMPLGGSSLKEWVNQRYLKNLGVVEIHIYDRDNPPPLDPKYIHSANSVNQRMDGSKAFITREEYNAVDYPKSEEEV
ncbi:ATP-binding protein [Paenibacillus vini]|uniref:ATP-binding protein n=1 Tax=Paenibacillus vini TaxID=1476024 RepID=UPI0025B63755|nr:ATP-binding protein [Paenibacillus vini]MDN4067619.1 ATP-binding protein [Paenibacillus vini]